MWFLGHFNKSEVDILDELQHELQDMEQGAAMLDEDTFWKSTEEILRG